MTLSNPSFKLTKLALPTPNEAFNVAIISSESSSMLSAEDTVFIMRYT